MAGKLLTTPLADWQAEILCWLRAFGLQYQIINPARVEQIHEDEFTVDGVCFIRDGKHFESGYWEDVPSGSRWEPDDCEFVVLASTDSLSLMNFVMETVRAALAIHLGYAAQAEAESRMYEADAYRAHGSKVNCFCPDCCPVPEFDYQGEF